MVKKNQPVVKDKLILRWMSVDVNENLTVVCL